MRKHRHYMMKENLDRNTFNKKLFSHASSVALRMTMSVCQVHNYDTDENVSKTVHFNQTCAKIDVSRETKPINNFNTSDISLEKIMLMLSCLTLH